MKQVRHRLNSIAMRSAPAFCAASFLFFLIYSTPHRVHHFFEQVPAAQSQSDDHHHTPTDHHNRRSNDADCVFQVSASRCQLGLAAQISPKPPPIWISPVEFADNVDDAADFRPAVFHIRAPPLA